MIERKESFGVPVNPQKLVIAAATSTVVWRENDSAFKLWRMTIQNVGTAVVKIRWSRNDVLGEDEAGTDDYNIILAASTALEDGLGSVGQVEGLITKQDIRQISVFSTTGTTIILSPFLSSNPKGILGTIYR